MFFRFNVFPFVHVESREEGVGFVAAMYACEVNLGRAGQKLPVNRFSADDEHFVAVAEGKGLLDVLGGVGTFNNGIASGKDYVFAVGQWAFWKRKVGFFFFFFGLSGSYRF